MILTPPNHPQREVLAAWVQCSGSLSAEVDFQREAAFASDLLLKGSRSFPDGLVHLGGVTWVCGQVLREFLLLRLAFRV